MRRDHDSRGWQSLAIDDLEHVSGGGGASNPRYAQGGSTVTAPDGGYHFGGSLAGKDNSLGGVPNGYSGALTQHTYPECVNVSMANALVSRTGLSPEEAQRQVSALEDHTHSVINRPALAAVQFGFTDVSTVSDPATAAQRALDEPGRALTATFYSPENSERFGIAPASVVRACQAAIGMPISTAHEVAITGAWTDATGGIRLGFDNQWGQHFSLPAPKLGPCGLRDVTLGTAPVGASGVHGMSDDQHNMRDGTGVAQAHGMSDAQHDARDGTGAAPSHPMSDAQHNMRDGTGAAPSHPMSDAQHNMRDGTGAAPSHPMSDAQHDARDGTSSSSTSSGGVSSGGRGGIGHA